MKVFGICASPRKSTTEYVLSQALDMLDCETVMFSCNNKDLKPCMHCDYCLENKKCIIDDFSELLQKYEYKQIILDLYPAKKEK